MITAQNLAKEYMQYAQFTCVRADCDRCGRCLRLDPECPRCDGRGYLEFAPDDYLEFVGSPPFDELADIAAGQPHEWADEWAIEIDAHAMMKEDW